jgi:hypothetical protein
MRIANRIFFVAILVCCFQISYANNFECQSLLEEIHYFYNLREDRPYDRWLGQMSRVDPFEEDFALSFGFYEFPPHLLRQAKATSPDLYFFSAEALSLRSFDYSQSLGDKKLLPPAVWFNNGHFEGNSFADPIYNAFVAAEKTIEIAKIKKHEGPLFVFFLDDFKGHRFLDHSTISVSAEDLTSVKTLKFILSPNPKAILEGFSESELRLLLAHPKFLARTQFVLKGKALNSSQVRNILGETLKHFPYFDEVYKP